MSRNFFWALGLATAIPLLTLPFFGEQMMHIRGPVAAPFVIYWLASGFSHIVATLWFRSDPEYKPVFDTSPARMTFAMFAVPGALVGVLILAPAVSLYLAAGYLIWQSHHFARQNYGILSFAAARDGCGPLPKGVDIAITLTAVAGAAAMISTVGIYAPGLGAKDFVTPQFVRVAISVGALALAASACVIIRTLVTSPQTRRAPTVLVFLALSWIFYLPGLIPGRPAVVSFWPFAVAHGAQYLIFMWVTASRAPPRKAAVPLFVGSAAVLGLGLFLLQTPILAQIALGFTAWHFMADARLWKLKNPVVRAIVRQRFSFVFSKPGQQGKTLERKPVLQTTLP